MYEIMVDYREVDFEECLKEVLGSDNLVDADFDSIVIMHIIGDNIYLVNNEGQEFGRFCQPSWGYVSSEEAWETHYTPEGMDNESAEKVDMNGLGLIPRFNNLKKLRIGFIDRIDIDNIT
jgi:hypothetical protein